MSSLLVFSVVIADACMLDRVIDCDARDALLQRFPARRQLPGSDPTPVLQRDIEGIGGQFRYEGP